MNLASVIILLQLAIGLLSNPSLAQNASLQAQATAFANQAITIATQALSQPPQTQLGVIPTSSTVFSPIVSSVPTTTDTSTPPPITIIINPPTQAPSLGTVNQTTTPPSISPILPNVQIAQAGADYITFKINKAGIYQNLSININSQTTIFPNNSVGSTVTVSGLSSKKSYLWNVTATNDGQSTSSRVSQTYTGEDVICNTSEFKIADDHLNCKSNYQDNTVQISFDSITFLLYHSYLATDTIALADDNGVIFFSKNYLTPNPKLHGAIYVGEEDPVTYQFTDKPNSLSISNKSTYSQSTGLTSISLSGFSPQGSLQFDAMTYEVNGIVKTIKYFPTGN